MGISLTLAPDGYGNNISSQAGAATGFNNFTFNALPSDRMPASDPNRVVTNWTYDTGGNGEAATLGTAIGSAKPVLSPSWDTSGRVKSMAMGGAQNFTDTYCYYPTGFRVQTIETPGGGGSTANNLRFAYTSGGLMLAEYSKPGSSWNWAGDVVYLGKLAIAEVTSTGTHELHCDLLGTPLVVTRGG